VSIVRSLIPGSGLSGLDNNGTMRSAISTNSSASGVTGVRDRLSASSTTGSGRYATAKRLSTLSTASSVVPVSTYSGDTTTRSSIYTYSNESEASSRRASVQSQQSQAVEHQPKRTSRTSSIRWDDKVLETVKEKRRGAKERRGGTTVAQTKRNGSIQSNDTRKGSDKSVGCTLAGNAFRCGLRLTTRPARPSLSMAAPEVA